jgi:hypothetical protein
MKLFERTGGHYLFWVGFVYLTVGTYNVFIYHFVPSEVLSLFWIGFLFLPFAVPQLGRWLNMSMPWDNREETPVSDNVVKFPEPKLVPLPSVPDAKLKQQEHYRVGTTLDGQTTLTLMVENGTSLTLTMNKGSCEHLIKMLRATYFDD